MIWLREIDAKKMIIVQLFGFMYYDKMTIFLDIVGNVEHNTTFMLEMLNKRPSYFFFFLI